MKQRRKIFAAVSSLAVISTVLLAGCSSPAKEETALENLTVKENENASEETGTLMLSVNPEIRIDYDKDGKVIALAGQNGDGKKVVNGYADYNGKECGVVLKDLVVEIDEAGYFDEDIDGKEKNIILQLEPGSVIPDKDFITEISVSTREAVENLKLSSDIVTIDDDDYDKAYAKGGQPSQYITLEKAQEIALAQAGVKAADAKFDDKEFDHDDGASVFELEFTANGVEYEYDVDAETGRIIKAEHKNISSQNGTSSGTTDYNDTDYGPNNDGVTDYDDTDYGPNNDGVTDYNDTDYGPNNDGVTDYNDTDYGPNNDGVTDYNDTDYGPNNDGVTDYNDTDYGPNNDGVTDYDDTDYGPNNDGVTDYDDTDYGPNNDGVTDYTPPAPTAPPATPEPTAPPATPEPTPAPPAPTTPPAPSGGSDYGDSGYGDSGYGDSGYDDGGSDYGDSGYDD